MEMTKWKWHKKPDKKLILLVIENARNAVMNAYYASQWIMIQQGNDSY